MAIPIPVLYVPNRATKGAALVAAHDMGWIWYDTAGLSLAALGRWTLEREVDTTHIILGGINRPHDQIRPISWLTAERAPSILADRPADYTLVNSLAHLRSYVARHRPKPSAVPQTEIPF